MKKRFFILLMIGVLGLPLACQTFVADPTVSPILKIHPPVPTATSTPTRTRTATPTTTWSPTATTTVLFTGGTCLFMPVTTWGGLGAGNGQFNAVADAATDLASNLYVLDAGNKRVQKFDAMGTYVSQWNLNGSLVVPTNIGVIKSVSKVYVLDMTSGQPFQGVVRVSSTTGVPYPGWVVPANSRGLATDDQARVYVGEQTIVVRYDQSGFNPFYYYSQGVTGSLFTGVQALAVDPSGNLFVALSSSIQKFNSSGQFLLRWGVPGVGNGQFSGIGYLTVSGTGDVYAVDNPTAGGLLSGRVQKFDNNGNFICDYRVMTVAQLAGLAFDPLGNLSIVDTLNSRIFKVTP